MISRRMQVDPERLSELLCPFRFKLHKVDEAFRSIHLVRPSKIAELYESVVVQHQGERGEAVYGGVGISVTRSPMQKELGEVEWIEEIAENKERGWTIIETPAKAIDWEQRLAELAPTRAESWAHRIGPQLLESTAGARRAAAGYLAELDRDEELPVQLQRMRRSLNEDMAQRAKSWVGWPLIHSVSDAEDVYELTCLCILRCQETVEPGSRSYVGQSPFDNKHLMWVIVIVADELLHREGYLPKLA